MNRIPTRRERRSAMKYHGILKRNSKLSFKKWIEHIKDSIKYGQDILSENFNKMEESVSTQLDKLELKRVDFWVDYGYNEEEIKKLREAHSILTIRDLSTWHQDKKHARNLIKEVNKTRKERLYG